MDTNNFDFTEMAQVVHRELEQECNRLTSASSNHIGRSERVSLKKLRIER